MLLAYEESGGHLFLFTPDTTSESVLRPESWQFCRGSPSWIWRIERKGWEVEKEKARKWKEVTN